MSSMIISWDSSHASEMLDEVIGSLEDGAVSRFFDTTVDNFLQERARLRFSGGGDDASGAWKPLTLETQERRRQLGFGPSSPINVRTSDLRTFIVNSQGRTWEQGDEVVYQFPGVDVQGEIGAKIEYAQGVTEPKNRRAVLAVNDVDQHYILSSFMQHIEDSVTV